jgi:sucrose-6-phosphatase
MTPPILICTDLDRTLLPNGPLPESPQARPLFARLAARADVRLAYVSGRDWSLVQQAMAQYGIPLPDFVIADVGASIYRPRIKPWVEHAVEYGIKQGIEPWTAWDEWEQRIAADWQGADHADLAALFRDLESLTPQEPSKQKRHKLSYYAPPDLDAASLLDTMQQRLDRRGVRARLVWSQDETTRQGLLDVLPAQAGKLAAIEFLLRREGFRPELTLFCGDSGNDLEVLASPIPAVLVANAIEPVRRQALELADRLGTGSRLYLARGGFLGMNGNYSAGILEGAAHFIPRIAHWLQTEAP